ncbi:Hypothetical predicted protein [Mytilus galloprovincialis]|uniref:Non-specific serine/threonine protein kinase n=1 Tax=Mytilus galloprovincialis TaxID=29158 RepID=A0A8B6CTV9_MYTGA|nr:Hypothetical predicted protein [Mytilus galloprovincialis]
MESWDEKLLTAAQDGIIEDVELCVKNGANLEYTNGSFDGETALHYAARNRQVEITKCLIEQGSSPWMKTRKGQTPFDMAKIKSKDSEEEKIKKTEVMDILKTAMEKTPKDYVHKKKSAMLDRLKGKGTYKSFDMRCMVTGQFGVGKSTLVKLLIGTYEASDVVYNKVLMTSVDTDKNKPTDQLDKSQASDTSPSGSKDETLVNPNVLLQQSQATEMPEQLTRSEYITSRHSAFIATSSQSSSNDGLSKKQRKQKMKSKMTEDKIRRDMEKFLKSGNFQMEVGRLIFWDFGGQYVYYTTHQTFMTYRALFLVIFDGSKGLHEQVLDVLGFPGQHTTPTPAVFLQHWVNCILTYCKAVYVGIPKILFVATHKDKIPTENIETQRREIYIGVEELFKNHEGHDHLILDKHIFVNATDKADPEIDVLKKTITDLTFKHPCWGEIMPNACVPLELEISVLVAKGRQILSVLELEELNSISQVSVLFPEELSDFLHFQHSLGKIVYFDTSTVERFCDH